MYFLYNDIWYWYASRRVNTLLCLTVISIAMQTCQKAIGVHGLLFLLHNSMRESWSHSCVVRCFRLVYYHDCSRSPISKLLDWIFFNSEKKRYHHWAVLCHLKTPFYFLVRSLGIRFCIKVNFKTSHSWCYSCTKKHWQFTSQDHTMSLLKFKRSSCKAWLSFFITQR